MRQLAIVLGLAAALAVNVASAQGGCQQFGAQVAIEGQSQFLRQELPPVATSGPMVVSDGVHLIHGIVCAP